MITTSPRVFSKKILTSFIAATGLALFTQAAIAQIGSASIKGVIAANMLPQPGLEVTAKNIETGYTYRAITLKDGTYVFKGLEPGKYQVSLKDKSGKAPETVVLKVGQSVALDFELEKAVKDEVEEITIIGSQLKYTSSGEIGTNISLEQISRLPQTTRNFLSFADLAPGVMFEQATDGSTRIKGGAQSANAINVFIDGVGQKNYVLKGGVTGQDSSRGNPFPQSAIGEYKVITQNYSAEYDQISSAAIVAVTASGTNEFHGGMFYDFSDEGMRKPTPSETKNNSKKIPSEQKQYGFHVGGPIIQDKMHFFFAYEGKDNTDPKDVIPGGGVTVDSLPSFLSSELGGRSATFEEDLYFGKLDYVISAEQKIELSAKIRDEIELTSIGGENALSYGTDKEIEETRIDLNHTYRTDAWLNDFHLIYEDASFNPHPHTIGIGKIYRNDANRTILNIGAGRDFQEKSQDGWGIQEDFSYLAITGHVIKTGFKFKSVELTAMEQQPYSPQFLYRLNFEPAIPFEVSWGAPLSGVGNGAAVADNKQYGVYLQDDWAATDRLTINVGLRWDYETSDSYLDYKTPGNLVTSLRGWTNLQNSDVNIEDYISSGSNRESFKDAWQPRLGFSYNLTEDTDVVLFGGIGRAYDRNIFDNLQVEITKATFPTYTRQFATGDNLGADFDCQLSEQNCLVWDPKYLTAEGLAELTGENSGAGREVNLLNNKLKTPYADQVSFGVRGSLNEDWKAEISLSRIHSKDGFVWRVGNRRADGSFFASGTTWGTPWGITPPGFGNFFLGDNGLETKTNSLFIKLDKPKEASSWGVTIAYTYSDATTNRKSPEIYAFDYPTVDDYGFHRANDLPEHRLIITGLIDLPLGVELSTKLNLQSKETFYGTDCRAGWNDCVYRTFTPNTIGTLGYRQLDIAFSKSFSTGAWVQDSNLRIRLDVLNLLDDVNYDGFQDWFGGANEKLNPDFGKPTDALAGPTRTVKIGLNWDW
jgi:outer membrane receptor protein involved in Fe transport